jgi:hypothetical protein
MIGSNFADKLTRVVAVAIGFSLVALLIVMARPAGGHGGVLPASLRFAASQDGAVAIIPAAPKPLLVSGPMRPGSHVAGKMRLRNETGKSLAVGFRAEPSSTALDGIAHVKITSGGKTIADTTLQALRQGSAGAVPLAPGRGASIRVLAWIPADTETGYEGASVDVQLATVDRGRR